MNSYPKFLFRIIRDVSNTFPYRVFRTQVYQALAAIFALAAGWLVFIVFLAFEKGQVEIFEYTHRFETTFNSLAVTFAAVGVFAVSRVLLDFAADISINRLCRLYEEHNVSRGFKTINKINLPTYSSLPNGIDRSSALKLIQSDSRTVATAQRIILRAIIPLITSLIGIVLLLYINPLSIAVVMSFLVISGVPLWLLSRQAMDLSQRFELEAQTLSNFKSQTLDEILQRPYNGGESSINFNSLSKSDAMKSFMDTFEKRFNVIAQANAASGLISAIVIAIVSGIFAWQALRGEIAWSFVILHFVALQFIFQAIRRVTALIVSMNRFYTQSKRYFDHIDKVIDTPQNTKVESSNTTLPTILRPNNNPNFALDVSAGGSAFIVSNAPLNRFSIYDLLIAFDVQKWANASFLKEPVFIDPTVDGSCKKSINAKALGEADRILCMETKEKKTRTGNPTPDFQAKLNDQLRWYLGKCIEASKGATSICIFDQRLLNKLRPDQMKAFLALFKNVFVLISAIRTLQPSRTWGIEYVVVFNGYSVTNILSMEQALADRDALKIMTEPPKFIATDNINDGA